MDLPLTAEGVYCFGQAEPRDANRIAATEIADGLS